MVTQINSNFIKQPKYDSNWVEILTITETEANSFSKTYVVPQNGWIRWVLYGAWTPIHTTINGFELGKAQNIPSLDVYSADSGIAPVNKGDSITLWTGNGDGHGYGAVVYRADD